MLKEIRKSSTIVFIDDFGDPPNFVGVAPEGWVRRIDRDRLLLAFAEEPFPLIHATTTTSFQKYYQINPVLMNSFVQIPLKELSTDGTIQAMRAQRGVYEQHHGIKISDKAIETAARYSAVYIKEGAQPDKEIQLLDAAASLLVSKLKPWKKEPANTPESTEPALRAELSDKDVLAVLNPDWNIPLNRLQ